MNPEQGYVTLSLYAPQISGGAASEKRSGAGEGNRTLVISLGSWSNAIIRHPLGTADFVPDVATDLKFFFAEPAFA